jgi:hypothetical protein
MSIGFEVAGDEIGRGKVSSEVMINPPRQTGNTTQSARIEERTKIGQCKRTSIDFLEGLHTYMVYRDLLTLRPLRSHFPAKHNPVT